MITEKEIKDIKISYGKMANIEYKDGLIVARNKRNPETLHTLPNGLKYMRVGNSQKVEVLAWINA